MSMPIAMKVLGNSSVRGLHRISLDPSIGSTLDRKAAGGPAVIVARRAAIVGEMSASVINVDDVIAVVQGDWQNALLLVLPEGSDAKPANDGASGAGDRRFQEDAKRRAKSVDLATLASDTIAAIRGAGVDGELVEQGYNRWVNRPLNTFTLKVQPKAGNIQFTLYGNPDTYNADDFLLPDQNSYSRGWVRSKADGQTLARLVKEAQVRRQR